MVMRCAEHQGSELEFEVHGSDSTFWLEARNKNYDGLTIYIQSHQELINLKNKILWAFEAWEREQK